MTLSWLHSITTKLVASFLVVAGLGALTGYVGLNGLYKLQASADQMYDQRCKPLGQITVAAVAVQGIRIGLRDVLLAGSPAEAVPHIAKIDADIARVEERLGMFEKSSGDKGGVADTIIAFKTAFDAYKPVVRKIQEAAAADKTAEVKQMLAGEGMVRVSEVLKAMNAMIDAEIASAKEMNETNHVIAAQDRQRMIYAVSGSLALSLLLGLGTSIMIGRPLAQLGRAARSIAQGDIDQKVTVRGKSEMGQLADAFRALIEYIQKVAQTSQAIGKGDLTVRIEPRSEKDMLSLSLQKAVDELSKTVGSIAGSARMLSSASEELSAESSQLGASAEETSSQATNVAASAEQVAKSVQTVTAGAEEMTSSIAEIARNTTHAADIAGGAVKTAEKANSTFDRLGTSASEIVNVTKMISGIAAQTNLLALNATIEAARAGEAGRGFAVVAGEVRELANQTTNATNEIAAKINTIQADTLHAVTAVREMTEVINQVNQIISTIASAIEEQNATTSEMVRSMSEAAQGTGEIASNIGGVSTAAKTTASGATTIHSMADSLAQMAAALTATVAEFKVSESDAVAAARPATDHGLKPTTHPPTASPRRAA